MAALHPANDSSPGAIARWLLDLGVLAGEDAPVGKADPEHPAASCLDLIDVMEALRLVTKCLRLSRSITAGPDVPRTATGLGPIPLRTGEDHDQHYGRQSPPAARSLHEIREAARLANCGECWQVPGTPCTPEGDHVARFGRAMRRGLISGPDLIAVLQALVVFTNDTVVHDAPDGAR